MMQILLLTPVASVLLICGTAENNRLIFAAHLPPTPFSSVTSKFKVSLTGNKAANARGETCHPSFNLKQGGMATNILEKWEIPFLQSTGFNFSHIEPCPRSHAAEDDACQIFWDPTSMDDINDQHNLNDMPHCDTCLRTYRWTCLLHHNLCTPSQRI